MSNTIRLSILASAALLSVALPAGAQAQQANMSFFVTSTGSGKGADLGGLAGADQRCQQLAQAAGATGKTWHAYLSTQAANGQPAVNARDRIGDGSVAERQGRGDRKERRRTPRRQQSHQADRALGKGQPDQGSRRQPQRA